MERDIRKIKEYPVTTAQESLFDHLLKNWHILIGWLRDCEDEDELFAMLAYEVQHKCRPSYLDRIRSRYSKVCMYKELKALEEVVGAVININYV